ncbi:MAG: cell division protein FtsB [Halioglobus sp.]
MRWLLVVLLVILAGLQYRLWFADGSLAEQHRLELQVQEQETINRELLQRNAVLEREVMELQSGNKGVEQRAREQLGLVREGEMFYQFVEGPPANTSLRPAPPATVQPDDEPAQAPHVAPAMGAEQ